MTQKITTQPLTPSGMTKRIGLSAGLLLLIAALAVGCGVGPHPPTSTGHVELDAEGHSHHTGEGCGVIHKEQGGDFDTQRAALCTSKSAKFPCVPPPAGAVEGYTSYVGQTTCSATAKPGVTAFKDLILKAYPCTGNFGIVRGCSVGGKSEHKEGRAWDWKVYAHNQGHIAQAVIDWLLATRNGVKHALARRVGLMYMIWNRRIWKAYQASRGWQAYTGASPHTDHIHFSFSWNGANKKTSFWKASCSNSCKPACVSKTKIRDKTCGVGDCAAFGANCVDDRLGVRCYSVFCPPLGTKKFCHDGQIGSCKDGKVTFTKCASGKTCTGGSSPVCKPKNKPTGYLDSAGCGTIKGWTQDPDHKSTSIDAHVYFNGPVGAKGVKGISTKANISRSDLCKAIGSCKHGFELLSPYSLHDGKDHPVHAYGIDVDGVGNPQLKNSPKTLKCSPKAPKGYVRRHIINQTSYAAWKVSSFWDKMPLSDSQINAITKSTPWPAKPELIKSKSSGALWMLHGGFKRKVPDNWKETWRFDTSGVQIWSDSMLSGTPTGPPLHGRIIYALHSSGAAYMLDAKLPEKPTPPNHEPEPPPSSDAGPGPQPTQQPDDTTDPTDAGAPPSDAGGTSPDERIKLPTPPPTQPPPSNGNQGGQSGQNNDGVTELPAPGQGQPTPTIRPSGMGCQIGDQSPSDAPLGGLALLFFAFFFGRRKR